MAKKLNWTYIVIVVLVIGALFMGGLLNFQNLPFSVGNGTLTTQPQGPINVVSTCEGSADLSLVYNIFDETPGNQTTSLNSDYNIVVFENGVMKGTYTAGSKITTVPNAVLTLYAVNASSGEHKVYGFSDVVTMECKNELRASYKGMQDSALTVVMYDVATGQSVANTSDAPTTLGAGEGIDAQWFVKASTAQGRYGTTEEEAKALVVIDYNSLMLKQPEITSVDGGTYVRDVIPNGHIASSVAGASGNASVAYIVSTEKLANLNNIKVNFRALALTGTTNLSSADSNIGITIYDSELYMKDNGEWVVGFRNLDTGADLGEANQTDVFHVA